MTGARTRGSRGYEMAYLVRYSRSPQPAVQDPGSSGLDHLGTWAPGQAEHRSGVRNDRYTVHYPGSLLVVAGGVLGAWLTRLIVFGWCGVGQQQH